jgi:ATP-binding cassette subfamily F protein 3
LAGSEQATSGELRLGHNADVDYFAQDQYKALDPNARMLDDLFEAAPRSTQTELRSLLGCFLFSEDDVFKTIGVLSGGERNRYALARMLLHPSNFLLLDEPTNHLDLRAKDVLLDSLQKFTGTVVFVSHDRYFIDKLATRVFEIGEGRVEVFPGNYEDYLWRKEGKNAIVDGALSAAAPAPSEANHREAAAEAAPETKQKRLNPIKLKQMKERVQEVEEEIARHEAAIAAAETALQNFVSVEETQRQTDLLNRARADLEQAMNEWEELSQALEAQIEV